MRKISKIMLLVCSLAMLFTFTCFAAQNKFVNVSWFSQPDPNAPDWREAADGTLQLIPAKKDASTVRTIAFVPPGMDATQLTTGNLLTNVDCEVEMKIPDAKASKDGWAGLYFRASLPQVGVGGYLVHINTDGVAILDGESGTPVVEERIAAEGLEADKFAKVRVKCEDKVFTVWVNGKVVYTKKNAYVKSGYVGLSTVNYEAEFRNYVLKVGKQEFKCFDVPGKLIKVTYQQVSEKPSSTAASSKTEQVNSKTEQESSEVLQASSEMQASAVSSNAVVSNAAQAGGNNAVWIVLGIVGAVIVAGAIVLFFVIKNKKK